MKHILLSLILCLGCLTSTYAQQAPDFTITDTHGDTHTLYADYLNQGYTVVLDLFFVNCGYCNALASYLEPTYQQWGGGNGDVQFFSLSPSDANAAIINFEDQHGLTFPAAGIDGDGDLAQMPYTNGELGESYGYPTLVVIAPDGSIQAAIGGGGVPNQSTIDELNEEITNTGATGEPINSSSAIAASFTSDIITACGSATVTFNNTSDNGNAFTWSFPGGTPATSTNINPTVVYDSAGTYDVTLVATNINGDDDMEEIADYLVVYDNPTFTVDVSGSTAEIVLDANVATPVAFEWAHDSSLTTASADNLVNGTYEVMVTDANGCVSIEVFSVLAASIDNLNNVPEMSILQNINSRQVTIQHLFPLTSNDVVSIYDYSGRLVQTMPLTASTQTVDLKADYAMGIYIVHVVVNNIRYSKKIMLK